MNEDVRRGPLIAVPLYRSPELVPPLFGALARMADEIARIGARILLIDDSPGHQGLADALARELPALAAACGATLVRNEANIGFVRTANRALAAARDDGRDAILLNSDAMPVPGAFAEMVAVAASDPSAGVVSPRSDNATICNSPYPGELRRTPEAALAAHRRIEPLLPRATPVPTAVGFCLLIRHAMLERFGLFDEIYGGGYNEENDYIRRINREGFRAILANRAYVHHLGSVSFGASDRGRTEREIANRAVLDGRYPEYAPAVGRWFDDPEYRTQRLLAGIVPDPDGRLRLTFDCRDAREADVALVAAFAARHGGRWCVRMLSGPEIAGTVRSDADACVTPSAAALRFGAPRDINDLVTLGELAPITALLVTDARPLDRASLDAQGVEALWQGTVETIALIAYTDARVRDRFLRDIAVPGSVGGFEPAADALAHACEAAIATLDYASIRRRQSRLTMHSRHRSATWTGQDAAAAERARVEAEMAGLHARAEALAADLSALAGPAYRL